VELVVTLKVKMGDREAPPRDQRIEVNGTVISPSGLTVTTLAAVDPQATLDALRSGSDPANVRTQVVKVAIEHHLVSTYTSLVAVDVTPTGPAGGTRSALVKASLPHGTAVGEIPQTDTAATLQLLAGLLALGAAAIFAVAARTRVKA